MNTNQLVRDKRVWMIAGVVLVILCLILMAIFLVARKGTDGGERSVAMPQVALATPTMISTSIPTLDMVIVDTWIAGKVDDDGFALFTNRADPTKTMIGKCECPLCPAPEPGHDYRLENGLLIPTEGEDSPLQKFMPQ